MQNAAGPVRPCKNSNNYVFQEWAIFVFNGIEGAMKSFVICRDTRHNDTWTAFEFWLGWYVQDKLMTCFYYVVC